MVRAAQVAEFEARFLSPRGGGALPPSSLPPSSPAAAAASAAGGVGSWAGWARAAACGELDGSSSSGAGGVSGNATELRSVLWRCAAGLLPLSCSHDAVLDTWPRTSTVLRGEYAALVERFPMAAAANGDGDAAELLEEIDADLDRLFPAGCEPEDLFARPESRLRSGLRRVLFVWARLHPRTGYRQGMHELAAPLIYWLDRESSSASEAAGNAVVAEGSSNGSSSSSSNRSSGNSSSSSNINGDQSATSCARPPTPPKPPNSSGIRRILEEEAAKRQQRVRAALGTVLGAEFIEPDTFWLFLRLMRDMEPLFLVSRRMTSEEIQAAVQKLRAKSKEQQQQGDAAQAHDQEASAPPADALPILALSDYVQNGLLARADAGLQGHLASLDVAPQLYALRWLRLLFARQFSIRDACVWDALLVDAFAFEERCAQVQAAAAVQDDSGHDEDCEAAAKALAQQSVASAAGPPPSGTAVAQGGLPRAAACLAVAMLVDVREPLLESDYVASLQLLMNYPAVQDPRKLLQRARLLRSQLAAGQ